jgi:polyhydroxybutyrate depolymerase
MRIRSIWMWIMPMIGVLLAACGGGGGGGSTPAPSAPAISAFSASPAQVQPGQSVTLSWTVQGATSVTISPGVGSVDGLSSRAVTPAAGTTYVLTAANPSGSVTASTTVTVASAPYPPGLAPGNLQVGGVTREFRVYTPAGLTGPPKALVLVLHGGGGAALNIANPGAHPLSVFRDVADREGLIVVYPGGQPALDGSPGWNDCRSDNQTSSNADDIGFLNALIEQLRTAYGLPTSKVFMAGGSNGAQMTLSYALAGPANVAAVASSNGNMAKSPKAGACSASPPRRLPVLMVHGTADPAMPYAGGCVANLGGNCTRGQVISAEATRDVWRQANGATGTPVQTVFNGDTSDPGPANRLAYHGPSDVEWWRMDGAGHPVASQKVLVPTTPESGSQNRDVDFAEIAWAFFKSKL